MNKLSTLPQEELLDSSLTDQLKKALSVWAQNARYPYSDLGDTVQIGAGKKLTEYRVTLVHKTENRSLKSFVVPDNGTAFPPLRVQLGATDPWSIFFPPVGGFSASRASVLVDGSVSVETCGECEGKKTVDCNGCNAQGKNTCQDCRADGTVDCGDCDGYGSRKCGTCGAKGKISCSSCNEAGETRCGECYMGKVASIQDPSQQVRCLKCSGSGLITCLKCQGRETEDCANCRGHGALVCAGCHGQKRVNCYTCKGQHSLTCARCVGKKYVECGTCEGQGRVQTGEMVVQEIRLISETANLPFTKNHPKGNSSVAANLDLVETDSFKVSPYAPGELDPQVLVLVDGLIRNASPLDGKNKLLGQQLTIEAAEQTQFEYRHGEVTYQAWYQSGVIYHANGDPVQDYQDKFKKDRIRDARDASKKFKFSLALAQLAEIKSVIPSAEVEKWPDYLKVVQRMVRLQGGVAVLAAWISLVVLDSRTGLVTLPILLGTLTSAYYFGKGIAKVSLFAISNLWLLAGMVFTLSLFLSFSAPVALGNLAVFAMIGVALSSCAEVRRSRKLTGTGMAWLIAGFVLSGFFFWMNLQFFISQSALRQFTLPL